MLLSESIQNILPPLSFYFDALPLFILLGTSILIMLLGLLAPPMKTNWIVFGITLLSLSAAAFYSLTSIHVSGSFWNHSVLIDGMSRMSSFIIILGTLFTLLCASTTENGQTLLKSELTTLLLFSSSGLIIMVMSGEIFSFFIGLEIVSLCLYVLIGYVRSARSGPHALASSMGLEASIKYFLLGSGASAIILMGSALIYASLGTLNFSNFYNLDFSNPFSMLGIFLFLFGLAFKVGMAPLHAWAPDIYEGANAHLSAYMASMIKFALVMVFIRLLSSFSFGSNILVYFFCILGVLSIIIGSLFGLVHNSIKRVLAYSSIANVGYFCVGFAALAKNPNHLFAKQTLFTYAVIYAILSLGAFHVLAWFEEKNREDLLKEELAGIGQKHPFPAFALSVFLFGLAGIPPLAGFFGKLMVIITAVQAHLTWFAIVLVIFSCFSLYYYLNLMVEIWFKPSTRYTVSVAQSARTNAIMGFMSFIVIVLVAGIGFFGI